MVNPWKDIPYGEKDSDIVNVIIEIPKDSSIKYEVDKKTGLLKLDRFLYSAVHYPGDYGFVPQTYWDDKDPIDILVITNRPVQPLTLARVKIIGVMRMIDNEEKDDKLVGVYADDPRFKEYENLKDLPKHILQELKHFFETYKELQGKKCKILEMLDKAHALKDVQRAAEMYKDKIVSK